MPVVVIIMTGRRYTHCSVVILDNDLLSGGGKRAGLEINGRGEDCREKEQDDASDGETPRYFDLRAVLPVCECTVDVYVCVAPVHDAGVPPCIALAVTAATAAATAAA